MFGNLFKKPAATVTETQGVIVQRADENGKLGQIKHTGVTSFVIADGFVQGRDFHGKTVMLFPASEVQAATVEVKT